MLLPPFFVTETEKEQSTVNEAAFRSNEIL